MDTNNWRPAPADGSGGGEPVMDAGDWRSQLQPNSRQRIVNVIMDALKRCVPFSGQEGLQELKKIAERFEENICTSATSQPDYLEKVSLKMLSIEMKSPNTMTNSLPSNSPNNYKSSESPPDTDSTAQTGNATNGDWQGEIYQKIRVMKEAYLPELIGLDQKIAGKLQQHESLPQQPKNKQLEKLKFSKIMLEGILQFLQVPKSRILPNFKEKVSAYEKHIAIFLNSSRPQKLASLHQGQGQQILPPHIGQSMEQSQQSQCHITQALPMHENHMNPQLQSMNVQGSSIAKVQQNNVASLQQNPLSALSGVSTTSQSMISSLQAGSAIDLGQACQGGALGALEEVPAGSLQQNHVNASQQANINSLSLHCGMNVLQQNLTPVQSSSNMLQNLHLKQQEQQMLQTRQKHQFELCHMQQQQQQQQRQLLDQPNKQQQNVQLQPPQKPQLHQMNDANDWKMRQQVGDKTGVFQRHYSVDQWSEYHHQQLKSGAQFPLSSSELLQPMSPLMPQHPSPQIDKQNLLTFLAKAGTPLQSTSLPSVVPFPSTPMAPSPISVESENANSGVSALLDAGKIGYEQAAGALKCDQIGTPGILASPLGEEFICPDGNHGNASPFVSGKSSLTEQPLDRLLKAVRSMSPTTLSASIGDIDSIISMMDTTAGSAPGNGSRAAVGEDLVAMTKWRLQARNKMRPCTSAMPLNDVSSAGSANYNFNHLTCSETSDSESTSTSGVKRPRFQGLDL